MAASASGNGDLSPATLLALLNHQLYLSTPMEKYATLFLGYYDGRSRRLTYTNGGHLPPLIIGEHGVVRRLQQGGTVVGLFDNLSFEEASVQLEAGELFVAYSDGVTEAEDKDRTLFGTERLVEALTGHGNDSIDDIRRHVLDCVNAWSRGTPQSDDITVLIVRYRTPS